MPAVKKFIYNGIIRKDRQTKKLVQRLRPGEIALVEHPDLDWVAAESLVRCGTKVILNTCSFYGGLFPPLALDLLLKNGVYLLEKVDPDLFEKVYEGDLVSVRGETVCIGQRQVAKGELIAQLSTDRQFNSRQEQEAIERFVINTLDYAYRERQLVTGQIPLPSFKVDFKGRHVVVVVRGKGYRDDLRAILSYLVARKPVLIGVDGGGDALVEFGFTPDVIIGDMDSVSDRALRRSRELVVHAYTDGRGAPGKQRLTQMGLDHQICRAPGTSEDIAMLIAYEAGAELLVAIGAHSSVVEFLEKGRQGMSSTFLVRLKVADRLVDAKGVSQLYHNGKKSALLPVVLIAGLMPGLVLAVFSPLLQHLLSLLLLRLRLAF